MQGQLSSIDINVLIESGAELDSPFSLVNMKLVDQPLTFINEAFSKMTGYTAAECLGRNCRFLQGKHTNPEAVRNIRTALATKSSVCQDIVNYTSAGIPFWNRLILLPLSGSEFTIGLQCDVTEKKERQGFCFEESETTVFPDLELRDRVLNPFNALILKKQFQNYKLDENVRQELQVSMRETIQELREVVVQYD